MLNKIREKINPWIEASAKPFARIGVSPNLISSVALGAGVLASLLFSLQKVRLAGIFVLAGGYLDVLDGAVARLTDQVTEFGGVLDSVLDRIMDAVLFIGIIAGGVGGFVWGPSWILPVLAMLGSFLVSYVRARAESSGIDKLDVGIAERAERLLILAVGSFLDLISYALIILVILTAVTVVQRIWETHLRLD